MFKNYQYFTNNKDTVIAVSTYAGKRVRGVAKTDPKDTFDLEKGKALAAARCNLKVAQKRAKRARKCYITESEKVKNIDNKFQQTCQYLKDSVEAVKIAQSELDNLISKF